MHKDKISEIKVQYSGKLYKNGAKNVNIVYGYGENWENTTKKEMLLTENGFCVNIDLANYSMVQYCFSDENEQWDNNNELNYSFNLENFVAPVYEEEVEPEVEAPLECAEEKVADATIKEAETGAVDVALEEAKATWEETTAEVTLNSDLEPTMETTIEPTVATTMEPTAGQTENISAQEVTERESEQKYVENIIKQQEYIAKTDLMEDEIPASVQQMQKEAELNAAKIAEINGAEVAPANVQMAAETASNEVQEAQENIQVEAGATVNEQENTPANVQMATEAAANEVQAVQENTQGNVQAATEVASNEVQEAQENAQTATVQNSTGKIELSTEDIAKLLNAMIAATPVANNVVNNNEGNLAENIVKENVEKIATNVQTQTQAQVQAETQAQTQTQVQAQTLSQTETQNAIQTENSEPISADETIDEDQIEYVSMYATEDDQNIENENSGLKDNSVLLISEVQNKVILPYTAEEVQQYIKDGYYNTVEEVITNQFTRKYSEYKDLYRARARETYKLVYEREKYSKLDAIEMSLEIMPKKYLHPAIISACRTIDELDVYIDCLEKNELDDFKIFDIEYEIYPIAPLYSRIGNKFSVFAKITEYLQRGRHATNPKR